VKPIPALNDEALWPGASTMTVAPGFTRLYRERYYIGTHFPACAVLPRTKPNSMVVWQRILSRRHEVCLHSAVEIAV